MSTKSTATALTVFALLVAAGPASAQFLGALDLTMSPSAGFPGVLAIVAPGDKVEIKIRQSRLGDQAGASKMQLYISPVKELGQLDPASAVLLAEAKVAPGGCLSVVLYIPDGLANTVWSLQGVAFYEQGGFATSGVLTTVITSEPEGVSPTDPHAPDEGPIKEPDADSSDEAEDQ